MSKVMRTELTKEEVKSIKEKVELLKKQNEIHVVTPVVVFGDKTRGDSKEVYIAYFKEPDFATFSKFLAAGKNDEMIAMRQIALDCFLEGDKEMIEDDSLFLFGASESLGGLFKRRHSIVVNF